MSIFGASIGQREIAQMDGDTVIDASQVAILLDKPYHQVLNYVTKGLPHFKVKVGAKNRLRFHKAKVMEWWAGPGTKYHVTKPRRRSDTATSQESRTLATSNYNSNGAGKWDALNNKTIKVKVFSEGGRYYVMGFEPNGKMHVLLEGK